MTRDGRVIWSGMAEKDTNTSILTPVVASSARPYRAVFTRRRVMPGELDHGFPVSVWYPALAEETTRRDGLFMLSAARDAAPAAGSFGLVLLSHGSGGSDINHHDWAETLARNGWVVVAPRHVGDSFDLNLGPASREQLMIRPRQLKAALNHALAELAFSSVIDRGRMGALGFSAGGYTCLTLLGAVPDFNRWRQYCVNHPTSAVVCPVGKRLDFPDASAADWLDVPEPRLRCAALLAPFALLFDAEALAKVDVPVRLYRARDESIARNQANADMVAEAVPEVEVFTEPGDHYVFLAPVAAAIADKYPEFYRDAPGVDRTAMHRRIGLELVEYYGRQLPQR